MFTTIPVSLNFIFMMCHWHELKFISLVPREQYIIFLIYLAVNGRKQFGEIIYMSYY